MRITKEAGAGEVLRRWLCAGERPEGVGEGVEGVHNISAELRAVSRSSERDRGNGSRWLSDGKHGGVVVVKGMEEEKGSLHRGWCSIYSRWRRLAKVA
jgi:hypothetical protein